jgi:hypothetical protein
MKNRNWLLRLIAILAVATCIRAAFAQVDVGVGVRVGNARAEVHIDDEDEGPEITVESFYEPLEPYGRWIETIRYGWVWHPHEMPDDWRPYSYGHWQCTEMGWVFVADHPWGWACYHYGRWLHTPDNGWIWIPGTVWAPAWVSWRSGGEHVGWAPLPPDPHYHAASVVIVEERNWHFDFVFVAGARFHEPCRPAVFVPATQQVNIINQTNNITNVKVVNKTVINNGPQIQHIEKVSNKSVNVVKVKDVQKTEINNYNANVSKTSPQKAKKIAAFTEAAERNTNAKLTKVERNDPEVQQRALRAAPGPVSDDDRRRGDGRGRNDAGGRDDAPGLDLNGPRGKGGGDGKQADAKKSSRDNPLNPAPEASSVPPTGGRTPKPGPGSPPDERSAGRGPRPGPSEPADGKSTDRSRGKSKSPLDGTTGGSNGPSVLAPPGSSDRPTGRMPQSPAGPRESQKNPGRTPSTGKAGPSAPPTPPPANGGNGNKDKEKDRKKDKKKDE